MSKTYPLFSPNLAPEWHVSSSQISYPDALARMEARVAEMIAGGAREQVWLLEHPALYTAGTSAKPADLTDPERFPVFKAGRGGQYTYHGPGQRVAYAMLDLSQRGKDIRCYVHQLEGWIIDTLSEFDIIAGRRDGRVGVWVDMPNGGEAKIAAIGVRVKKWVTFHGISINLNPDLSHFGGIVPCGIAEHGVSSLEGLGVSASLEDLDAAMLRQFMKRFGPVA